MSERESRRSPEIHLSFLPPLLTPSLAHSLARLLGKPFLPLPSFVDFPYYSIGVVDLFQSSFYDPQLDIICIYKINLLEKLLIGTHCSLYVDGDKFNNNE